MEESQLNIQNKIEKCDEILGKNQNDFATYYRRGKLKIKLQDYSGAIEDLTNAINKSPKKSNVYEDDTPDYYYERAQAKTELKDYLGAIDDYTTAIDKDKIGDCRYYQHRGNVKIKLKNYKEAIDDLTEAIKITHFNDEELYLQRAMAKREIYDFKGASDDYNSAVDVGESYFVDYLDGVLESLEEYRIESDGDFWQQNGGGTEISNLIKKIKKEKEKANYLLLEGILKDAEFVKLLENLKEKLNLAKYEKLLPFEKAKIQYYKGNYSKASDILKLNNINPEEDYKFFIKLKLKLLDANFKIDSSGDEEDWTGNDEIEGNKYYLEFEKKHRTERHNLCNDWDRCLKNKNILSYIKSDPKHAIDKIINDIDFILSSKSLNLLFDNISNREGDVLKAIEINLVKSALYSSWCAEIEMDAENYRDEPSWRDISNREAFDTDEQ